MIMGIQINYRSWWAHNVRKAFGIKKVKWVSAHSLTMVLTNYRLYAKIKSSAYDEIYRDLQSAYKHGLLTYW